jgi:hypothetical protein
MLWSLENFDEVKMGGGVFMRSTQHKLGALHLPQLFFKENVQEENFCRDIWLSWFSYIFKQSSKLYIKLPLVPHREHSPCPL